MQDSSDKTAVTLSSRDGRFIGPALSDSVYRWLGAHRCHLDGVDGVNFLVWAPMASRVALVGSFNDWDGSRHQMLRHDDRGLWELFVPEVEQGALYKYEIHNAEGALQPLKADPFGFAMEHTPGTASVVWSLDNYDWQDHDWPTRRLASNARNAPISIYEVHLASWRRQGEEGNRYLSYRELAEQLIPHVSGLGFTHIELMPISEYPFDGSWGYQPVGMFAPTSRFGTPDDFKYFIDQCHQAGLAVLVDWVPGHFPTDDHGLGRFDGSCLYEHEDPRLGFHPDWNTLIYNYGRPEVISFLCSNALFWLDQYHIDGLRVDAVASMLYRDYSRKEGEWLPNIHGGRENLEAIDLIRKFNAGAFGGFPGTTTVAEESTAWPGVTRPTDHDGLGFGYKWNMGWMFDTLQFMSTPVDGKHERYHNVTFALSYSFDENFVLPLSHDEVVHHGSLLGQMPGDDWQRFANLRAYFGFMWTHPGKKLLFMGGEFAQLDKWNHDKGLDWQLLDQPLHRGMMQLIRDLNAFYRSTPALHRLDCERSGFEWIEADGQHSLVYAFLRHADDGSSPVVVVCNFSPEPRPNYRVGVPKEGHYQEKFNTDAECYGGANGGNFGGVRADHESAQGRPFSIRLNLPALSTLVFQLGD